jgi:type VI secretion system secreted protein VgrG
VKSPSVDFQSGSPDQLDALKSDKPFVQECKGK